MPRLILQPIHTAVAAQCRQAADHLVIFSPFVTLPALRAMLDGVSTPRVTLVTTWEIADILGGCSDLAVYPWLRARGGEVRLLPGLHMKVTVADGRSAVVATGNYTRAGLGLSMSPRIECAVAVPELHPDDAAALAHWRAESVAVDDALHAAYEAHVRGCPPPPPPPPAFDLDGWRRRQGAPTLAQLPEHDSPAQLLEALDGERSPAADAALRHDMALLGVVPGRPREENLARMRAAFMALPLVRDFIRHIRTPRYFHEVKEWLQGIAATETGGSPPPTLRQLVPAAQRLYAWMEALGEGRCRVSQPRHSQRIEWEAADAPEYSPVDAPPKRRARPSRPGRRSPAPSGHPAPRPAFG